MRLLECQLVENECYQIYNGIILQPEGIVVHSTDKAGKVLKRFVQPADGQTVGLMDGEQPVSAARMLEILGVNQNRNSWNRPGVKAAVHAFIGQMADGSYAVCKTLPYTSPCWGSGSGPNGSYNGCLNGKAKPPLYVQFEMIEDSGNDLAHCKALYNLAVEYAAYLCQMFPSIKIENIVGHKEVCERGYSSNRTDPLAYWQRCGSGFTMDGFRKDVKAKLAASEAPSDGPIYRVQVGAFRNRVYADAYLQQVREIYPDAYITTR